MNRCSNHVLQGKSLLFQPIEAQKTVNPWPGLFQPIRIVKMPEGDYILQFLNDLPIYLTSMCQKEEVPNISLWWVCYRSQTFLGSSGSPCGYSTVAHYQCTPRADAIFVKQKENTSSTPFGTIWFAFDWRSILSFIALSFSHEIEAIDESLSGASILRGMTHTGRCGIHN
jgi:hypothetical protein